jgi:hypothetical protein
LALRLTLALFDLGPVRMSTSKIVDFIVDNAASALARDAPGETFSRAEIAEAWLYQALEQLAAARGVEPLPKAN